MPAQAPANLVQLLGRLKLATPQQVAAIAPRAARLAGDLPVFESVWVDALAQRRVLTAWQAAEINAGRGDALLHGPYRIQDQVIGTDYARCYTATHVESNHLARLYVARSEQRPLGETLQQLRAWHAQTTELAEASGRMVEFGTSKATVWVAYCHQPGICVGEWTTQNGRLPPQAVLQIARELMAHLHALESRDLVHGDLGAGNLLIDASGRVLLVATGLRGILRPHEGYAFSDLQPSAYDYLAPERIALGTPPDRASDVYACGCLLWHLLAGRPPFPGGNALAKLKAAHAARVADVRSFAPTTADVLYDAIAACLQREPGKRPRDFAALAEILGPPTTAGQHVLASLLRGPSGTWQAMRSPGVTARRSGNKRRLAIGATTALATIAMMLTPWALRRDSGPESIAVPTTAEKIAPADAVATTTTSQPQTRPTKPRVDLAVKQAAASVPHVEPIVEDLVLPSGEPLRVEQLDLKPNVRVRGRGGNRPLLIVPPRGLIVACEGVRFEGVDFVWGHALPRSEQHSAMLDIRVQSVSFRGCSFTSRTAEAPAALLFSGNGETLPGLGRELHLNDCVFDGLSAVVEVPASGTLSVRLTNCLCVAAGPILRLARPPRQPEAVDLLLDHVTTRGDTGVLHCGFGRATIAPGPIHITSNGSALAAGGRSGLVTLTGRQPPTQLIAALTWNGQGSIVTPQTPLLLWQSEANRRQAISEDDLEVAGLVRGALEFSGRPDGPPESSRVIRWQVPLRSPDPPGADPSRLSKPGAPASES